MHTRKDELSHFKEAINLSEYAANQGYLLDLKASSRNSAIMKLGGDKIVITQNFNKHWMYFSISDDTDNGTIIDFVQNRQKDLGSIRARFQNMAVIEGSEYLENTRKIPSQVFSSPRFHGKIYIDQRSNIIFTGFAPNGEKGVWHSNLLESDQTLVIGESAIDLLSFAALHPSESARYLSLGGSLNKAQPELIQRSVEKMPENAEIILAMDNDDGGKAMVEAVKGCISPQIGRDRLISVFTPSGKGQDWNDALRAK